VVVVLAIGVCVIDAAIPSNPVTFAQKALRVKIPEGTTVIIDNYSEPSFPSGDGYSWTVLQISPDQIDEFITSLEKFPGWKPLPLPEELAEHERFLQPTIMLFGEEEIPITTATGYYLFIDEQVEERRQSSDIATPFYARPSFNYRFGLFNDKDGRLYIWSIDT
jgi:hypothetical protein